jgi:membrane protein DedA with SNARE-associated domain
MLGRYIPGGRVATMFTAGALHYPYRKFLVTETVAVSVWSVFFSVLGYAGGASFQEHPVLGMLLAFSIVGALAGLIEVGRRLVRRRRERDGRDARLATEESYSLT